MIPLAESVLVLVGGPTNAHWPGTPMKSSPSRPAVELDADLRRVRRIGARSVIWVGGEPTLRRDLPELLKMASRRGLESGIVTNGRLLVYSKLRRILLKGGVSYFQLGLHSPAPSEHDCLVGVAGAFEQTFEGLRGLLAEAGPQVRVDVACTVLRGNVDNLTSLVELVTGLDRRATLGVRFVAPNDPSTPDDWVTASKVAAEIPRALSSVSLGGSDLVPAWEGFAPCLVDGGAHLRDECLRYGVPRFGEDVATSAIPLEGSEDRSHPFPCQECVHEATCPGAPTRLLQFEGERVLRPTRSVRANSFNFEHQRRLDDFTLQASECSARQLEFGSPLVRHLLLAQSDGVHLYHSPTSDFTDEEIRKVRDEVAQVYIDLSSAAALEDFQREVRRVVPHDECSKCEHRTSCCGAVVVDPNPPFQREERWLRKEVSRLRGRVLDVGCGEQLYRDEVKKLIADGVIEYHGLDPDKEALARLRASGMGGTIHLGQIEEFEWEPEYFDYVLSFRSLNHFLDMERAFRVIARVMRVQGQLVLCDSPPFAMLRSPDQVAFADRHARVGHEHFRNWTSHQVVAFLKRFPFRVDVHRPVNVETSNQWILKFMRVSESGREYGQ